LIDEIAATLSADQVDALLRETGRKLARDLTRGKKIAGDLRSRVKKASEMLNRELGASTSVEANGHLAIRGAGCPLATLTAAHPLVCVAMESLIGEVVGAPARHCCDRAERPRCRFEIATSSSATSFALEPSRPSHGPR